MDTETFFYHHQKKQHVSKRSFSVQKILITIVLLFLCGIGFIVILHIKKAPTEPIALVSENLVSKVSRHTTLPDTTPTIATVTDPSQLKGQSFFRDAQVGDKVLMYREDKLVLLYRPSTDTLLQTAPLISEE